MSAQERSLSEYAVAEDDLGCYARVSVDPNLYSPTVIFKTAYWFTDQCYLYLAKRASKIEVEFRLKSGDSSDDLKKICGQFLNSLLDQSVRQKVLEETAGIRDTLLKKAFFDARVSVEKELVSDESHIPDIQQSFKDDPLKISGR